ncbi:ankyrin repeat-containing domain protein, partial [Cladorrhinum samala]
LPAEILVEIAEFLDVASLWQFMQTSERYYSIGIKALRNVILTEPNQGREIVFWAAEAGNHRALKDVLERGVDPNGVYFSPILASRMADAMNGGPIHPCPTLNSLSVESQTALDFEIEREILCRHEVIRNHHFSQEGVTEISQQSSRHSSGGFGEAGFVSSGIFAPDAWRTLHDPSLRGVAPWGTAASDKKYRKLWYWCPIHVAAKSGDNVAIELLLKHGAKINAVCSGLCSCSYPHLSANQFSSFKDTVNPLCTRSLWTPLHVAMCHGHRHTVQLLVEKRASEWIGGVRSPPHNEISSSHEVGRFQCRMSAIDYAAWKGDAELCEFLLAQTPSPIPVTFSQCTPIYWAAAGGHIQTIGNLLFNYDSARCLDAVAKQSRLMRSFCSVLEILCTDQRYDDATWLLEKCRRHGAFTSMDHRDSFGQSLTAALGRLCGIERPANHTLDLRQQQDLLSRKGAPDSAAKEFERRARDSENDRVVLAAKLLRYGADPNLELTTWSNRHGYKYPPIYFAATACFPKMVKLLIQSGASLTLP